MSLKVKKMNISNAKKATTNEIMAHHDNKNFTRKDVINISLDTTKEDELFDYVDYHRYYDVSKYNELDDDLNLNL